jgi:predicted nucleotidyltransferase
VTELPIERLLLDAISVIDGERIEYAILGGFAVRTWGVPRPTYDADLAVVAEGTALQKLLDSLAARGFDVPEEHAKGFVDRIAGMGKVKVTRFVERTVWQVDLFLVQGPLLESAMRRRRAVKFAGRSVWVLAPEDLILLKLIAFRRKDQLDIEEMLKLVQDLDKAYLQEWATRLRVDERLREFLPPRP